MNKIMKYGFVVLLALGMLTSCMDKNARKNNYPSPNIPEPMVGRDFTISELVQMISISGDPDYYNDTIFKEECFVYGIVTDDELSGNIYKASFIQERETNKAIELYMKSVTGLRIGDSVKVCLKGAVLGAYKGTPQIQNLDPVNVIIKENCLYIDPEVTTITEINTQNKLCQLIKLENVQFTAADTTKTWADATGYGNRNLEQFVPVIHGNDTTWNKIGEMVVRTSNYSSFATKPLPTGNGSIIAIASIYNDIWQLIVRDDTEAIMNGERH